MCGEPRHSRINNMMLADMMTGTESEILKIGGAQLFLLDREESVVMGVGDFALIMVVQANTSLGTLVAQVGEFQWPVGKDGPVLKLANLRYTFAIPGLLYGLILPDGTPQDVLLNFETYLRRYCAFEVRLDIQFAKAAVGNDLRLWHSMAGGVDMVADGVRYWTAVAGDVEEYSTKLVRQMNSRSKAVTSNLNDIDGWASPGIQHRGVGSPGTRNNRDQMSQRMRKRVDQARRMSAVAKLLSRTVLRGAISATGHVANFLGSTILSGRPCVRAFMSSETRREVALASVDAFAKVVEAVETAGKSLATVSSDVTQLRIAGQLAQDEGNEMIDNIWTLNKVGLQILWHATAASTAMNASRFHSSVTSPLASECSVRSSAHTDSPTSVFPSSNSGFSSPTSVFSMSKQSSLGPAISQSPPAQLHTVQLLPSSTAAPIAGSLGAQSNPYPIHSSSLYMDPMNPVYGAYYNPPAPHHSNSSFQQYARPNGPPQMQYFFPCAGLDGSNSH